MTEWSNGGLAGHLARSAFNLELALDQRGSDEGVVDAVAYYANSDPEPPDSQIGRRIRQLGDQEAAPGQAVLADRFAASVARLRDQAVPVSPTVAVQMFGRLLPIDDCAAACLLELVVHTDDLAVSLGLPTPLFSALPSCLKGTTAFEQVAIGGATSRRRSSPAVDAGAADRSATFTATVS
ncbi:maleylpyruvate isomerase N-terminal domain-containing protein [Hamadaea tsunoensis]|uniref:maleylpyruvate isomerase N-terminal domain-containing protein n=1 Tax=Hamadaea tsunoensis TaxID=53368 RepID=UPI0004008513|nr:maleylpyruvate isomerase N-terminal domain-containing protein [Hamadaea tsunoensis]